MKSRRAGMIATLTIGAACGRAPAVDRAPQPAPVVWTIIDTMPATAAHQVRLGDGAAVMAMAIPADDTLRFPTRPLARRVDLIVIKLLDEHSPTGAPGPIATSEGVRRRLALRVADVGPDKLVAGLPYYGYLWRVNQPAVRIDMDGARQAAAQANVELVRDPASGSLHAVQPGAWELWIVDDVQLRALRREAESLGVKRIAVFVKR